MMDKGYVITIVNKAKKTMYLIGSKPPDCNTQSEKCAPCKPVLVKVPLETAPSIDDYYPEIWMCICNCK
ncbi:hypothetical protein Pfo_025547 [Paulownia fortunei]|nr:hypothetical protein Pfo_025547 [Paulownia fortunei]